jgi:hypothetical protein
MIFLSNRSYLGLLLGAACWQYLSLPQPDGSESRPCHENQRRSQTAATVFHQGGGTEPMFVTFTRMNLSGVASFGTT